MALFNSKASDAPQAFKREPRKAGNWFKHAQATADSRQYDYAIECYVNGLRLDPDNLKEHESLREVALKRKVAGGKPAGMFEALKGGGKTPVEKMAHAEMLWAKDPLNAGHALSVMENAVEAHQTLTGLMMGPVVNWVGGILLESGQTSKKLSKSQYIKARDCLAAVRAFERAAQACRLALAQDEDNANLLLDLKNLEAERIMAQAGYSEAAAGGEGSFTAAVKNIDQQRLLEAGDQINKTESAIDSLIAQRRGEFEENPQDLARLSKLAEVLVQKGTDESDAEAMRLLAKAWEDTGQYRLKVRRGDIYMRQLNRHQRQLKAQIEAHPEDAELKKKFSELGRARLQFELEEFAERVKNYPTDMALRFELGKRLYMAKKPDEAIAAFQEAQADAKHRVPALQYLGMCYLAKGWTDEAVSTLRKGIETYAITDDKLAMDLRYLLMESLESSARKTRNLDLAREAQQIASTIVQTDINYRDIRDRLAKLRALVEELGK